MTDNPSGTQPEEAMRTLPPSQAVQNDSPPETQSPPPVGAQTNVPVSKQPWFLPTVVGAGALVVGLIGGVGIGVAIGAATSNAAQGIAAASAAEEAEAAKDDFFATAAERCKITSLVEVADGGRTMIVDGEGEDAFTGDVSFTALECIIEQVATPRATKQVMFETRSLDGRQADSWEIDGVEVEASWSYHPDDGLDIIFELVD